MASWCPRYRSWWGGLVSVRWLMVTPVLNLYLYPVLVMSRLTGLTPVQNSSVNSDIFCIWWWHVWLLPGTSWWVWMLAFCSSIVLTCVAYTLSLGRHMWYIIASLHQFYIISRCPWMLCSSSLLPINMSWFLHTWRAYILPYSKWNVFLMLLLYLFWTQKKKKKRKKRCVSVSAADSVAMHHCGMFSSGSPSRSASGEWHLW